MKSADSFFEEEPVSEREVLFSNPVINGSDESKKGEYSSNLIPNYPSPLPEPIIEHHEEDLED